MKLTSQIAEVLESEFATVHVVDDRGDGHFVEIICVDEKFEGVTLLAKSRLIFQALKPFQEKVHAWSVKGFTSEEWEKEKVNFSPQVYKHYSS